MRHCGRSRGAAGRLAPLAPGERGLTTVDLVMALAVIVLLGGLVMPATATVIDASRARHAAGFMATHFRLARLQALARTRTVGLVFDLVNGQWTFRVCSDGNGNGLRRADLAAGVDPCAPEVHDVAQLFPSVAIGVDPQLRGPAGEPGSGDPVRFGVSDILSFSTAGTCTAGTLFLRTSQGTQYAVRISNVTTRTRLLRYEAGRWVPA
jgi:hypothetical protein